MSPGMIIKDQFVVNICHVIPSQPLFWSIYWVVLWQFWPKLQLWMIVHYKCTYFNSLVVHWRGTRVLGGESKTYFLTNLAMLYPGKSCFIGEKLKQGPRWQKRSPGLPIKGGDTYFLAKHLVWNPRRHAAKHLVWNPKRHATRSRSHWHMHIHPATSYVIHRMYGH